MDQERIEQRKQALPWHGEAVVNFYLAAKEPFPYGEKFAELIYEAYQAFIAGCPRASIIISGEALLQAIFYKVAKELISLGTISNRKKGIKLSKDNLNHVRNLSDYLTFDQALAILKQEGLYSAALIERMYIIKSLRNDAAHGEFPLLDYWDPDDPRDKDQLLALLQGQIEIPEGYRFIPSRGDKVWFTLACRDYNCGSLKALSIESRFAAIQLVLTFDTISKMSPH